MVKSKRKFGFTMAEMLVALAVISVIATILIPAIMQVKPDKNKVLFKKAYYISERIVSELINDESLYETVDDKYGFDNLSEVKYSGSLTAKGNTKFCTLFASKVNTLEEDPDCTANALSFVTSDGIAWFLPVSDFSTEQKIKVDINNTVDNGGKGPDCTYNASTCKDPDQFEIYIEPDGKMSVKTDLEKEYLRSNETMKQSKKS